MNITIGQVIGGMLVLACILGAVLMLLSFVVPRLRFSRGRTVADQDETGLGGPKPR